MSLTAANRSAVVKKQYFYKIKAYSRVFSSMMILQILAIIFSSFGGVSSFGTGNGSIQINANFYSSTIVIAMTMMWAVWTALLITTRAYRYDDFAFVTNRVSGNFANILFLATSSVIGGICALLTGSFIKDVMYYVADSHFVIAAPFEVSTLLIGMASTILYVLLSHSLGYLAGMIIQLNRIFGILIPAFVIWGLIFGGRTGITPKIFHFYFGETSFLMFFIKMILTAGLSFAVAMLISNRMEVRK